MILFITAMMLVCIVFTLTGCNEQNKTTYYHEVFRQNTDGTYTKWTVLDSVTVDGAFVCWDRKDGSTMHISGNITIIDKPVIKTKATKKETK
jgi:uncharacterized lipoprotein NlpE involved in copper resistance